MKVLIQGAVVFACISTTWAGPAKDAAKKDMEALQGTWELVEVEKGGVKVFPNENDPTKYSLEVKDDTHRIKVKIGNVDGGSDGKNVFKLDPTTMPKRLDFKNSGTDFWGECIYDIQGDTLKLSLTLVKDPGKNTTPLKSRPKDFSTKADSDQLLLVWSRVKQK